MMSSPLKFPQPTLPFKREISHPGVGTSVQIRGHPFEDKIKSFTVAIDTDRDTAINLSCRVGNNGEIIATASIGGSVTSEVTRPCSLSPRKMLKLVVTANEHVFEVFLNDVFILDFVHRVNPLDYKYLTINGPIICEEVLLTPGQMPSSMSDPLPPPPTYEASLIAPSRELNQLDRDMQRMNVSGPGSTYPPSQPPGPGYPPQATGQTQGFNKLPYAYDQQPANQNPTNPFQQGYQQAPAGTVRPDQSYSTASTVPVSGGSISDKRKLFEKEGLAEKIRQQAQAPNSSPIRTGSSSSSPYAPMPQPGLSQPAANYPQYANAVPQTTGAQPYPSGQPGYPPSSVSSSQRASPPFPNPPASRELPYANVRQGGPAPGINVIPSTPLGTTGGPGYPPSGPGSFQAGGLPPGSSSAYKGSQSGVPRGGSPQGYPMPQPAPMNMPTPYSGGSPGQSPYGSSPQNPNPYPGGGPMNQYVPQPTNSYPSGGPTNQYPPGPTNSYPSGGPTNQYSPGPTNSYPGGGPTNQYAPPTNSYPGGGPTNQYVPQPANSYPGGGQHVNQYVPRPITPPSPQNASYNPGTNYYPGPGGPTNVQYLPANPMISVQNTNFYPGPGYAMPALQHYYANSVMGAVSYQGHGGGQYYTGGFDQPTYVAGVPVPQVVHTTSYNGCQTRCRSYSSCSD